MASPKRAVQVLPSASRGTKTSDTSDIGDANVLVAFQNVTAQSGTNPTLDGVIQDSADGVTWHTLITFTQVTGATDDQVIQATRPPLKYIRYVGTVGGTSTPLFTYSVTILAFTGEQVSVTTALGGALAGSSLQIGPSPFGTMGQITIASENLTLSTGGATTDTTANLLPANSLILFVGAIVTTTITTATDWKLGDANVAGRFTAANSTLTAGTRDGSSVQWLANTTAANAGPYQVSAAKVRVTTTGTPGAGAVRIVVIALTFTPPTS